MIAASRRAAATALILCVAACARGSGPRVEQWSDGAYRPLAVSAYTIEGHRDGAKTQAVATFTLEDNRHIRVVFDVVYNPTPALGTAHWDVDFENATGGTVHAESVRFLGGQGAGPSLGGRFLLESDGAPRFRVVLPPRTISNSSWTSR